jgi:hypothetical protein
LMRMRSAVASRSNSPLFIRKASASACTMNLDGAILPLVMLRTCSYVVPVRLAQVPYGQIQFLHSLGQHFARAGGQVKL